jgi:hypothetical protein
MNTEENKNKPDIGIAVIAVASFLIGIISDVDAAGKVFRMLGAFVFLSIAYGLIRNYKPTKQPATTIKQ